MTTLAYNGETAIPALAQQRRHQAHHALGTDIDLTLLVVIVTSTYKLLAILSTNMKTA